MQLLTQENQNGEPAKAPAVICPNRMFNGRQTWLDGLVAFALLASKA
jgi:poly(A) polymerase